VTSAPNRAANVLEEVLTDLEVETSRLRAAVTGAGLTALRAPTPARGWTVATQIVHLAWTDEAALLAIAAAAGDGDGWETLLSRGLKDPEHFVDDEALAGTRAPDSQILARWDAACRRLPHALRAAIGKLPWFGPAMSPTSMATARLMETWAHGLDVFEAIGVEPEITDAIYHVCHLGVRTRDFAYHVNGLEPPGGEFRIELTAPSGGLWVWGPDDSEDRISGAAYDFARVVTQRVHRHDTGLRASGAFAPAWLDVAQAFAGPPGDRRGSSSAIGRQRL
jgi:uncharacterized protein (TIGR03084 family)